MSRILYTYPKILRYFLGNGFLIASAIPIASQSTTKPTRQFVEIARMATTRLYKTFTLQLYLIHLSKSFLLSLLFQTQNTTSITLSQLFSIPLLQIMLISMSNNQKGLKIVLVEFVDYVEPCIVYIDHYYSSTKQSFKYLWSWDFSLLPPNSTCSKINKLVYCFFYIQITFTLLHLHKIISRRSIVFSRTISI